jgi:hypothetical protein
MRIEKHTRLDRIDRQKVIRRAALKRFQAQLRALPVDSVRARRETEMLLLLRIVTPMEKLQRAAIVHQAAVKDKPKRLPRLIRLQHAMDAIRRIQRARHVARLREIEKEIVEKKLPRPADLDRLRLSNADVLRPGGTRNSRRSAKASSMKEMSASPVRVHWR